MKDQSKAVIFALLAILCWSTVASAFKIGLHYLNLTQLLFFSCISSLATLIIILLAQGKLREIKKTTLKSALVSMFLGALNPFTYYLILLKAYDILPAQEALTLNYTWVIVAVLLSTIFLKQKISIKELSALLISFTGVIVIATHGNPLELKFSNSFGVFLAVVSSLVWASYWILNIKDKGDRLIKLLLNFLFGTIYISVIFFYENNFNFIFLNIFPAIYIGLFEMSIAFFFWLSALHYSQSTVKISNLIYLSPFLSLIFINLVLGERILISTFFGLLLIISGIIIQQLIKNEK